MTEPESTRPQRRKEARPAELAAAALSLFIEKGFAATRLDEVAARAGVSKGTLYLYFDSKEALFKSVIEEGVVPIFEEFEARLEILGDDPERLLREILRGWWTNVGATDLGGIGKLIIAEADNFPEVARYHQEAVIVRWMTLLRRVITMGVDKGIFRSLDVEPLSQLMFFPLLMLSVWKNSMASCVVGREAPHQISDSYFDTYFDLIFRGLLVAPREESKE